MRFTAKPPELVVNPEYKALLEGVDNLVKNASVDVDKKPQELSFFGNDKYLRPAPLTIPRSPIDSFILKPSPPVSTPPKLLPPRNLHTVRDGRIRFQNDAVFGFRVCKDLKEVLLHEFAYPELRRDVRRLRGLRLLAPGPAPLLPFICIARSEVRQTYHRCMQGAARYSSRQHRGSRRYAGARAQVSPGTHSSTGG
jgi:hypothetical protein